jgi:putative MATE family efflux protein
MSILSDEIKNEILNGSIKKTTLKLALPVLIGQILVVCYGLADSFFVSMINRNSTSLISAVGLVFPVYFFFMAISLGLSNGLSSLVARAKGEGNNSVFEKVGDSGLFLAVLLSLVTVITFYLTASGLVNILSGISITEETKTNALSYLYYIIPGFAFLILFQTLSGILQGEGLMHYTAIAMFLSVILNIILDPIFIFIFKMGINGAGFATTISIVISFCYLLFVFLIDKSVIKIRFNINKVDFIQIREIIRIGAPQSINMILLSFSFMAINYCVSSIGEDVMNAWTLVGRLDDFILMIGYALSSSTITMTGQNYGSNNLDRVKKSYKINLIYGVIGSIILAMIYNLFAYPLFNLISNNQAVVKYCIQQVRLISFSYTGIVASIILNSLFLGTGKSLPGLLFNFVRIYIFVVPLTFIFVFIFKYDILNVILLFVTANVLTLFATLIISTIYLRCLKFRTVF